MKPSWHKADSTRTCIIASLPCNETCKGKETTTQWGTCSPGSGSFFDFIRRQQSSDESPSGLLADAGMARYTFPGSGAPFSLFFSKKRQKICQKISKNVKIYQHNKNIENKLKYFEKCVDKYATLYYIKLNKRETEQPNREGWERSTKESIEREV